jgi:hypothetical protein
MSAAKPCPKNYLLNNAFSVSLTELITLDVIAAVGVGLYAANYYDLSTAYSFAVVIILLIATMCVTRLIGYDSNLCYFVGIGEAPHRFKVCPCYQNNPAS